MHFTTVDYCTFLGFIAFVVGFSMYKSRQERTSEDYFLAGRNLTWWLIGLSMIAANISTEHFVGMSGRGYELGMAVASYEWTAAIAMVLVAWFFLPKFLRSGIYTIPEYLEVRYSSGTRGLMAVYMMVAYVVVAIAAVLYSGAIALDTIFDFKDVELVHWVWLIGVIAGVYTVYGGLKAVAWADMICTVGLIAGGALVTYLGFQALGGERGVAHGVSHFFEQAGDKLATVKPYYHKETPWIAIFIGGLWVPQLFYWGLNQFICQRSLAARSVSEGQKGVLFAACLKLLIPFIIIFPGIMAYELYAGQVPTADKAYPFLLNKLLPLGLRGMMFAALFGAVMSTLDSQFNAASTIFTMDFYKRYWNKEASSHSLVWVGRTMTALFVVIGCLWAPLIAQIGGGSVFIYIQTIWGFISPGVVAAFLFGLFSKRTPSLAATGAMLLGIPVYAWCLWAMPSVAFLYHMAFTFMALSAYMMIVTLLMPLREVAASAGDQPSAEGPDGSMKRTLVPYATVAIGGFLLSRPVFQFSYVSLALINGVPEWVHFVTGGVAVTLYVAAALYAMRRPTSSVRLVASAKEGQALRPENTPKRLAGLGVLGLLGGAVLFVHLYLVLSWSLPAQYLQRTLPVVLAPAVVTPDGAILQREIFLQLTPLIIAPILTLLFLAAAAMIWWKPAAREIEVAPTVAIDLRTSRLAPAWGVAIIAAVAVLYYFFF